MPEKLFEVTRSPQQLILTRLPGAAVADARVMGLLCLGALGLTILIYGVESYLGRGEDSLWWFFGLFWLMTLGNYLRQVFICRRALRGDRWIFDKTSGTLEHNSTVRGALGDFLCVRAVADWHGSATIMLDRPMALPIPISGEFASKSQELRELAQTIADFTGLPLEEYKL